MCVDDGYAWRRSGFGDAFLWLVGADDKRHTANSKRQKWPDSKSG